MREGTHALNCCSNISSMSELFSPESSKVGNPADGFESWHAYLLAFGEATRLAEMARFDHGWDGTSRRESAAKSRLSSAR
jgi:hypothetical protein